jgi:hypothetical protein
MQNSILQWVAHKTLDRSLQPRELLTARKIIYTVLIVVLFTVSFMWRRYIVETRANELAVREQNMGDVELSGSVIRHSLTGLRGVVTAGLWMSAMDHYKKNQWNELEYQVRWLTRLQPHFTTPWLYQSWNLAYNVVADVDRVNDKYFYIARGVTLLAEGERQNNNHPDLRFSIGWTTQHKICKSDETNTMRSLFQLSCIPPNERDPARFRIGTTNEFNWKEFEKFCKEHPQLVRRLHDGMHRELSSDQTTQFTCQRADDVMQFLRDNWRVPSLYEDGLPTPADSPWRADKQDNKRLDPKERFPVLPPVAHQESKERPKRPGIPFEPAYGYQELTDESPLRDDLDGYVVARTWFSYAQEPLPEPDVLPGFSKEITDRAHQRKNHGMTTLIFRNYPPLIQSYAAERLQEEGWFDETPWPIFNWFKPRDNRFSDGPAQVAVSKAVSSEQAWTDASRMWEKHGKTNHLIFESPQEEYEKESKADEYRRRKKLSPGAAPPMPAMVDLHLPQYLRDRRQRAEYARYLEELPEEERPLYEAARFLYEYNFYRKLTNFSHHYHRSYVETEKPTIKSRRLMFLAETYGLQHPKRALDTYNDPAALAAWRDEVMSVKDLSKHKEFRDDSFNQEHTFEFQLKYMDVINELHGRSIKQQVTLAQAMLDQMGKLSRVGGCLVVPECCGFYELAHLQVELGSKRFTTYIQPAQETPAHVSGALALLAPGVETNLLLAGHTVAAWKVYPPRDVIMGLASLNWRKPPGTLAWFNGPFNVNIPSGEKPSDMYALPALFLGLSPLPGNALLTPTTLLCGEVKPLLPPDIIFQVLARKKLLSRSAVARMNETHKEMMKRNMR